MKSGFYKTNLEQIIFRTLLNFYLNTFPPVNDPKTAIIILVGCAQTAAVLDESMLGMMGDR